MQVTQQEIFEVGVDDLRKTLFNPAKLALCIPKCTRMEGTPQTGFEFELRHKIGVVSIVLPGRIAVVPTADPNAFDLGVTAQSLVTGKLSAQIAVILAPAPRGSLLTCTLTTETPRLAKVFGQDRLIAMMDIGVRHFLTSLHAATMTS